MRLTDYEELSNSKPSERLALLVRKIGLTRFIIVTIALIILPIVIGTYIAQTANRERDAAETARSLAESRSREDESARALAESRSREAVGQSREAEAARVLAESQSREAESQSREAEAARALAESQSREAEAAKDIAETKNRDRALTDYSFVMNHKFDDIVLRLEAIKLQLEKPSLNRTQLTKDIFEAQKEVGQLQKEVVDYLMRRPKKTGERRQNDLFAFVSNAFAQDIDKRSSDSSRGRVSDEMRTWIMALVFVVLGMTFVISIVSIFRTTNAEVLKFSFDTVKTLLGFFIGVATTLIGTS